MQGYVDSLCAFLSNENIDWRCYDDYNCDEVGMDDVLEDLTAIASDRNDCYVLRMNADYRITGSALMFDLCQSQAEQVMGRYSTNMDGTYYVTFEEFEIGYSYYIYQKPVFFYAGPCSDYGRRNDGITFHTTN